MKLRLENLPIAPRARVLGASEDEVRLAVDGLVCNICAGRVQAALAQMPGVASAECSLETGEALVTLDESQSDAELIAAVESTVVLPGARRWLTWLWEGVRHG